MPLNVMQRSEVPAAPLKHLEMAFLCMTSMVDIAYTVAPTPEQVRAFGVSATEMRWRLARLGAPSTVWGHVWTVHMAQFLERWGTLWPFLCHGVEGRHKPFKRELRMSTGAQWSASGVGFAQVLKQDVISWNLRAVPQLVRAKRYQCSRRSDFTAVFQDISAWLRRFSSPFPASFRCLVSLLSSSASFPLSFS